MLHAFGLAPQEKARRAGKMRPTTAAEHAYQQCQRADESTDAHSRRLPQPYAHQFTAHRRDVRHAVHEDHRAANLALPDSERGARREGLRRQRDGPARRAGWRRGAGGVDLAKSRKYKKDKCPM